MTQFLRLANIERWAFKLKRTVYFITFMRLLQLGTGLAGTWLATPRWRGGRWAGAPHDEVRVRRIVSVLPIEPGQAGAVHIHQYRCDGFRNSDGPACEQHMSKGNIVFTLLLRTS